MFPKLRCAPHLLALIALVALVPCPAFAQASSGIDTVGLNQLPFSIKGTEVMELDSTGTSPNNINSLNLMGGNMDIYTSATGATLTLQANASGHGVVIGSAGTIGTTNGNSLTVYGGLTTYEALNQPLPQTAGSYGGSPKIFVNGDNHNGGGIQISDEGGFFDYNDGLITYNGSVGLHIAGSSGLATGAGPANLIVDNTIFTPGTIKIGGTMSVVQPSQSGGFLVQGTINVLNPTVTITPGAGGGISIGSGSVNTNNQPAICLNGYGCDSYWGQLPAKMTSNLVQGGYATCQATTDQYGQAYINGASGRIWSSVSMTSTTPQQIQFTVCMVDQTGVWLSDNSWSNFWNSLTLAQQQQWLIDNPQPPPSPSQPQNYSGFGPWQTQ